MILEAPNLILMQGALLYGILYPISAIDWSRSSDTTGANEEVTQSIAT